MPILVVFAAARAPEESQTIVAARDKMVANLRAADGYAGPGGGGPPATDTRQ